MKSSTLELGFSFVIPTKDGIQNFKVVTNTIVSHFHWRDSFLLYNQVFKVLNDYIKGKTMIDKKVLRLTETVAGSG